MKKSQSNKSYRTFMGYSPVPIGIMERNLDCVNRWINQNIMPSNQTMVNYPQDVIK